MRAFALAFVAGTLLLHQQPHLPSASWAGAGLALLLSVRLVPARQRLARRALALAAGAALGFGHGAWRAQALLDDALAARLEGEDVEVVGVVASLPRHGPRGTRFVLARESGHGVPRRISVTWYAERGRDGAATPPALEAGERWRFVLRLKRPRGLANPHGFDFERWAFERGLRATGYVRARPAPERLAAHVAGWPQSLHRWRGGVREAMRSRLGEAPLAGVLVALAIGDQDSIETSAWEVFWRTGVGHLMSISGLHITMLGALAFACAKLAWVRVPRLAARIPARKAAILAGMLAALAYCLATGYAVPAQRTFLMLAVVAACVLAERHGSPSRVLALAALAVAAFDPWSVSAAGFWLSFGAVAAIFYAFALRAGRPARWRAAAVGQLAVTVLMLPLLLALFQQVSIVSPLANALAIPVVNLAVVPLTLAGAFLALGPLLDLAHAVMALLMGALEAMAAWPLAMVESHAPEPWTVALALAGCAWLCAPRGVPMRSCGAVWVAPLVLVAPPRPAEGAAWIDVLDVGGGLAVVVRTAHHALAYDAGPAWSDSDSSLRIVAPFLRGEGVRRLDGLVVSHADDDHAGGARSLLEARRPGWMLSPLPAGHALHAAAPRSLRCEAGRSWRWDGVEFRVLHPAAASYASARRPNDSSCVVHVRARASSALLTGDVEARGEAEMLARDRAGLGADVLLVPHHGSRTSSTPAFIDAVAPSMAIVSAAHRSRFGHPHGLVIGRYTARGIAVRGTAEHGALHIRLPASAGEPIAVRGARARRRYWNP